MNNATGTVTLLARSSQGDLAARDRLLQRLYTEIIKYARYKSPRHWNPPMSAVELAHDAYIKVFSDPESEDGSGQKRRMPAFDSRKAFLLYLAQAMKNLVIDEAKHRQTQSAGGGWTRAETEEGDLVETVGAELGALQIKIDPVHLDLDRAIQLLSPDLAEVVHLKYWLGMTDKEAGTELGLKASEVQARWKQANVKLRQHFRDRSPEPR
jgi:RNA polymerase sigma factor (sigma-70 family)